ncbi:MAG: lamin tail domain-containing protein [Candidatus Neomarinimicrobiota bacterium]
MHKRKLINRLIKLLIIGLINFFFLSAQLIFNEFMIDPENENTGEFIEVFNNSNSVIDLTEYYLCDEQDTDRIIAFPDSLLAPDNYALIIDPNYAGEYDEFIPTTSILVSIEDSRFGKYGISNSTAKTFSLLDKKSNVIDSYRTGTPLWPPSCYTIERYKFTENEWLCSLFKPGTPGSKNSVSPQNKELQIEHIDLSIESGFLEISFESSNIGFETISRFDYEINISFDEKFESINTKIMNTFEQDIAAGDSLTINTKTKLLCKGNVFIEVCLIHEKFTDTLSRYADIPVLENDIIITEFVSKPKDNFSCEYFELFSKCTLPIQIRNLEVWDLTGSIKPDTSFILWPDSLIVLAQSRTFHDDFPYVKKYIHPKAWRSLNNSEDIICISNVSSLCICELHYDKNWNIADDCAMQLIDFSLDYRDPYNWECTTSGTPGKINQTQQELLHLSCYTKKDFYTPLDTLFLTIINDGFFSCENFIMTINQDQNIDLPSLSPGDTFIFFPDTSFFISEGTHSVSVNCSTLFDHSIDYYRPYSEAPCLLNEIFFDPIDTYGQEEFIEIENMKDTLDLKNWKLQINNRRIILEGSLINYYGILCSKSSYLSNYSSAIALSNFPSLPNSGAEVYILDPMDKIIDFCDLRDHSQITEGQSLEKQFQSISSEDPSQWFSSVAENGMTPSDRNSITALEASRNSIGIYPEIFSPGEDEHIQFSIDSEFGLKFCELLCFNMAGQLIYKKKQNCFSQASTMIFWDGKLSDRSWPKRGIYLVVVLMHDLDNKVFRMKKSFVVK